MAKRRGGELASIGIGEMWETGPMIRANRINGTYPKLKINPITAGIYCAMMMAQIDVLLANGHSFSEVANESVIEAVDSLNPYMHLAGVDFMARNCSITAQRGTHRYGPRFDYITSRITQIMMQTNRVNAGEMQYFLNHPIHQALEVCCSLRPPIDIALGAAA